MSLEVTPIVIDAPLTLGLAHPPASQAEAEAGTEAALRSFSPLRIKQAIEALAGTGGPLNNFAATTDPGVGDDSGDGYGVGSVWINVTLDRIWQCQSASVGAAVWERLDETLQHNLSATTDPGVGDDSADGYSVGSKWVNVSLDKVFECLDASSGAAVWAQTNASGSSLPVVDETALVHKTGDATARIRLDAENISTGQTREIKIPNRNVLVGVVPYQFLLNTGEGDLTTSLYWELMMTCAEGRIVGIHADIADGGDGAPTLGVTVNDGSPVLSVTLNNSSGPNPTKNGASQDLSGSAYNFGPGSVVDLIVTNDGSHPTTGNPASGLLRVTLFVSYSSLV